MENIKKITIVSGAFNEEDNIDEYYQSIIKAIYSLESKYIFEIIVIDNASTDRTVEKLMAFASRDKKLKIIVNNRNFGHIRSPYWGILQAKGDAIIYLASDLQDPPEYISSFIEFWEMGWKVVMATKPESETGFIFNKIRKMYYRFLNKISDIDIIKDATGFGLYDKDVINKIKEINDPYPFFRGLISELGYPIKTINFKQPRRLRGISKNNFFTLYEIAMLGIISHSMLPLRLAGLVGFVVSIASLFIGIVYLILKVLYWNSFPAGVAPLIIGVFFLFGLLFGFIGLLGEYIGSIHTYVKRRPIVVEKQRYNFENE